jgi:DNA polymerase III delta prime subunit
VSEAQEKTHAEANPDFTVEPSAPRRAVVDENGRRRYFTQEQKSRAIDLYELCGPREASKRLRGTDIEVSESTLTRWATKAGVSVQHAITDNQVARAASLAKRQRTSEETKLFLTERLQTIAEIATERELTLLRQTGLSLRDVVGSRTRAVHDLQLLSGQATETVGQTTDQLSIEDLEAKLAERAAQASSPDPANNGHVGG